MQKRVRNVCLMLLAATVVPLLAQQQSGGTISGTALDQTARPIAAAAVEVSNEATGDLRSTVADAEGRFSVSNLPPASYRIRVSAPGFALATRSGAKLSAGATLDVPVTMSVETLSTSVTVSESVSLAAVSAPSGNTLDAVSAKTEVSSDFIKNFMSPLADYAEYVNYAPGTFSLNPNGIGLGQGKTFFRGFADGDYTMTFDGIPFQDTNSPTHHSWAFFPAPMIGSVLVDRSPGSASTIGPANFGGSINMLSPTPEDKSQTTGTVSYGSFDTRMFDVHYSTGAFGGSDTQTLSFDAQDMRSNGYQTFNRQQRDDLAVKYTNRLSDTTTLTA